MKRLVPAALVALSLGACASKSAHMRPVAGDAGVALKAGKDEAIVVFMRPSIYGGAIQSSVFDATTPESKFIGIVSAHTKVAYRTTPGEHVFMVVSEAADFMSAQLEPGKTYYARVSARVGMWKARFSLAPVSKVDLGMPEFASDDGSCDLVENGPTAVEWANENAASIQTKRVEYFQKWMSKPEAERPVLRAGDGV
ncbi:MAG TPA: hypothetical protein VFP65_22960 [Anaeromyxobacteraceae bacterium]|nr:hypothetical protein [Anaeromyxobacteraceae bacterium]